MQRLVIALGVSLLSFSCGSSKTVSDVVKVSKVDIHGRTRFSVSNKWGAVFILGSRSLPPACWGHLVRKVRAANDKKARQLLDNLVPVHEASKGALKFSVQGGGTWAVADLKLNVSVDSDVSVRTVRGKIRIYGIHGQVAADADHGAVDLKGMVGSVKAHTKHGDVVVTGYLTGVEATTGHGDVRVRWNRAPEAGLTPSVLRSDQGNVRVQFPDDLKVNLSIRAGKGIVANFELKRVGKQRATAVLAGGGKLLSIEAPKGKVDIIRLPAMPVVHINTKGPPPIRGGHWVKPSKMGRPALVLPVPKRGRRKSAMGTPPPTKARGSKPAVH